MALLFCDWVYWHTHLSFGNNSWEKIDYSPETYLLRRFIYSDFIYQSNCEYWKKSESDADEVNQDKR